MRVLFALFMLICPFIVSGQKSETLTEAQWKEDLEFLKDRIYKIVPEAEKRIDKTAFDQQYQQLIQDLPSLSTEEIVVGLEELLALTNDNGCYLYPYQPAIDFPVLPIKSYWFSDGLYVCDAADDYQELIGQKLTHINGTPMEDAFAKMKATLPADNETYQRYIFPMYVQIPAWQKRVGLSKQGEKTTLETAGGEEVNVAFAPVKEYIPLKRSLAGQNRLSGSPTDHSGENYWMEYIPEKKALFLQFRFIGDNDKGPSFKDFVKKTEKEFESGRVEILVIDNRYGGGGNGFKLKPFTDLIRDTKVINQFGKLFILTGRTTQGTVLEMTSVLSLNTKAILVGEPTGEGPNRVGDTKSVGLPNSGISVNLTHIFWPTSWVEDLRSTIQPHVPVEYTYADYHTEKDPWLEAVYDFEKEIEKNLIEKSLAQTLAGKHDLAGRSVEIEKRGEHLFLTMSRKMKSFFELSTELYFESEGRLSCDIQGVYFYYSIKDGEASLLKTDWKGIEVK